MIESFIDVSYRGFDLGRRIKLTHVTPTRGYVQLPLPMPVGTRLTLATDEGVEIDSVVELVHEQIAGQTHAPGMRVRPDLSVDRAASWWAARVTEASGPVVQPAALRGALAHAAGVAPVVPVTLPPPAMMDVAAPVAVPPVSEPASPEANVTLTALHAVADDGLATMVMPEMTQEEADRLVPDARPSTPVISSDKPDKKKKGRSKR